MYRLPIYFTFSLLLIACASEPKQNHEDQEQNPITEAPADTFYMTNTYLEMESDSGHQTYASDLMNQKGIHFLFQDIDAGHRLLYSASAKVDSLFSGTDVKLETLSLILTALSKDQSELPFRVSIRHKVKDYETWKWLYDASEESRINAGLELIQFGTVANDPNEVFMIYALPDISKAKDILQGPSLKKKMEQSGVIGDPEVRFWRPLSN